MEIAVKKSGFTLVELIVIVAIIGILAAIAYPSYQEYVKKTKRVEVQAELIEIASRLQRYKVTNFHYKKTDTTAITLTDVGFPSINPTSQNGLYTLSLNFTTFDTTKGEFPTKWTLSAVPIGTQAGNGVTCMNESGQRFWSKTTATSAACLVGLTAVSNWDGR
ncbi:type IV pilin protein [Acinetobacter schindleri]|jgi:type IV pilus assembly protein PilE|uniref:type IV pilin protein n=1 Tax=Acinetobacter schindleri TaxID=108981 RepID=UPI002FDD2302